MTSDLESALREARQRIYDCKHNAMFSSKETVVKYVAELLPRIDAALSAASGEAGGDETHFEEWSRVIKSSSRPAPSEAPNVERAGKLTDEQLREWIEEHERAPWITDKKKHPQNIYGARLLAILKDLRALRARIAELEKERDSARAEGIAAMRECAAKILEDENQYRRSLIIAAIREAKP